MIKNLEDDTFLSTKSEAYYQLGEIEMAQKKYTLAIYYFDIANAINANDDTNFEATKKILKQLSVAHEKNNNINKSQYFLKKYVTFSDSITKNFIRFDSENMIDKVQFN